MDKTNKLGKNNYIVSRVTYRKSNFVFLKFTNHNVKYFIKLY